MIKTAKRIIVLLGLVLLSSQVLLYSQKGESKELSKETVFITVEDSIKLGTDLYLPEGDGPFPCILVRLPYNMNGIGEGGENYIRSFLKNGWVTVMQDTRGKFESNGIYHPFKHERSDGLATVKWIRSQAWSNGKIAGWGGSYVGYTQWAIADQLDVITSSLFPRYNRNLNSGEDIFNAQNPRIARQKLYFGEKYPSHITLPVMDLN